MKFFSTFSGIEAASVAWRPLGWECVGLAEVEPFPCAVLAHHYPDVPNYGDVTKFKEWPDAEFDVLVGGSPCQSFSVAGLRKGLDDPRGNLMLTYLAIAGRYRPRWVLWENVPGVLSADKGRAFATFLGGLAELGYGFAYRVLDAQYFGVPQRRRRVFVVGYLGDWRRAAAVLFDRSSLSGDSAPSRGAREDTAHGVAPCIGASGRGFSRTGDTRGQDCVVADTLRGHPRPGSNSVGAIVGTLQANGKAAGSATQQDAESGLLVAFGGNNQSGPIEVSTALSAHAGPHGRMDFASETFIAIQESATLENPAAGPQGAGFRDDGQAFTLEARHRPQAVAFDLAQVTPPGTRSNPKEGDPCHPLSGEAERTAIAFNARQDPVNGPVNGPVDTDPMTSAVAFDCKASGRNGFGVGDQAPTLRAMGSRVNHQNAGGQVAVQGGMQVRRITPREAERLQGFPDDYTLIEWGRWIRPEKLDLDFVKYLLRGGVMTREQCHRAAADGPRYKALGNSMAVPVIRHLGERIALIDELSLSLDRAPCGATENQTDNSKENK